MIGASRALQERADIDVEPDNEAKLAEQAAVFFTHDDAAAGGDDGGSALAVVAAI